MGHLSLVLGLAGGALAVMSRSFLPGHPLFVLFELSSAFSLCFRQLCSLFSSCLSRLYEVKLLTISLLLTLFPTPLFFLYLTFVYDRFLFYCEVHFKFYVLTSINLPLC